MIKQELIKNIVRKFNVEEIKAADFVDGIFNAMAGAFADGKNVNIPEFGKFRVINKSIEGKRIKYVSFSPAKKFADDVNENFTGLKTVITSISGKPGDSLLFVREIMPDDNDSEYLCFMFDDAELDETSSAIKKPQDPVSESKENRESNDVYNLPEEKSKIKHDLQDEFSNDDISGEFVSVLAQKDEILSELHTVESDKDVKSESAEESKKSEEESSAPIQTEDDIILESDAKSSDDIIITSSKDDSIQEPEIKEEATKAKPDVLSDGKDSSNNSPGAAIPKTSNLDLLVFQRLLRDTSEEAPEPDTVTEIPKPAGKEKPEQEEKEFATLSDALSNIQSGTLTVENSEKQSVEEKKSFNEVFETNKEIPAAQKHKQIKKPVKKRSGFLKFLMFIPVFVLAVVLIFYLIRLLFTSFDIIPEYIKESEKNGTETVNGESIEVENYYDVVFRKLGKDYYIQNKVFDSISGANEQKDKFSSMNVPCRIEAAMSLDNRIQYRVLIGPFESIEKAREYFEEHKSGLAAFL